MIVPIAAWHEEHVYFMQLLNRLQREVDAFYRGEAANYALMLDIVSYLRDYGDQFHHPREDEAFGRLGAACPDLRPVLERLQQEHAVIAKAGEDLSAHLVAILSGAVVPRAQVEAAATTYVVYYCSHLSREEEEVLTRAAQALTPADWEAVRLCAPAGLDPDRGPQHYRELRRRIALES